VNVAYITADAEVPVFGSRGCSVHVQEIIRAMGRRGLKVDIFAGSFGGAVTTEFSSLRMASIAAPKGRNRAEREKALATANASLRALLMERHAENPYSLVYERYSLWSSAAMDFACEQQIPGILEVNAPLLEEKTARHLLIDRAGAEEATMRAFKSARAIVVGSRQLAALIEKHPSAMGKVHVVPNGVDPDRFIGAHPALERGPEDFILGFTGELNASQGLPTLIAAFQLVADALPSSRLVIVGEGPDREPLERDVAARGLEKHVVFVGAVGPHAIPGMLASMDVALAPYPKLAGFYDSPLKIFEYMAAGLPIVASKIGQLEEVLNHGETAMLVQPGEREALAEMIYELAENPDKRRQLGTAAQARVRECYTWENALDLILNLAGSTNSQKRRPAKLAAA
jgi:glycosyltransferase involved in cell wall biosynthesis